MSSMYGHIHSASSNHNWSVIETFTKTLSSCSDADCFTLFGRIASSGSAGNPYLDGTGLKEKDSDKWPIDFLKQSSSIIHYELQVLTMNYCSLQWAGFWCHELPANSIFRYGWHSDEVHIHKTFKKCKKHAVLLWAIASQIGIPQGLAARQILRTLAQRGTVPAPWCIGCVPTCVLIEQDGKWNRLPSKVVKTSRISALQSLKEGFWQQPGAGGTKPTCILENVRHQFPGFNMVLVFISCDSKVCVAIKTGSNAETQLPLRQASWWLS